MDRREAVALLEQKLSEYRTLSYEQLRARLGQQDRHEVYGPSGVWYQIQVQFVWDSRPDGDIRVLGATDDGGVCAFLPLTSDFIRAPDGSFVGENA